MSRRSPFVIELSDEDRGRLEALTRKVIKWRKRFFEAGIASLADRKRSGRRRRFSPSAVVLDSEGSEVLAEFEMKLACKGRDPSLLQDFPFDLAARHVTARWDAASGGLIGNWLQSVRQRAAKRLYIDSGA